MYLDDEQNQLELLQTAILEDEVLFLNGNSFERKICKCICRSDELKNNSGHNALPPDFYSDNMNIMFDIYRVNDSEIKKNLNPTARAEKEMQQLIENTPLSNSFPHLVDNLICIDKDYTSNEIHNMNNYIKNILRVTKQHLSSKKHPNKIKDIWMKEHPTITRKGLVVYDETENYFQGTCMKIDNENNWGFIGYKAEPFVLYKPWMDGNILRPIYNSDCDFLIWFMPYKFTDLIQHTKEGFFPMVAVMDTRFSRADYIEYDYSKFTRT